MTIKKLSIKINDMTCESCEKIISKQVHKLDGIKSVNVDYVTGKAHLEFDSKKISLKKIISAIEDKGYSCSKEEDSPSQYNFRNIFLWVFSIIGIITVGYFLLQYVNGINMPTISQNMGYGLLFVVGLLTGFHCVSMCGGFVVSYTAKGVKDGKKPHQMHLSYAVGKTVSYTIIGALFGLLGSIIAFTPMIRGMAGIFAGLFLIIFGLNMLNIFPMFKKFRLRLPSGLAKKVGINSHKSNNPLIIGLLNGLMIACGPLQAIYIMAAGTGSMIEGAKLLFVFALGTLPVMLGFGYIASLISGKATQKILKASAVIVIILGIVMFNRGLALTGSGYDFNSLTANIETSSDFEGTDSYGDSDSIAVIKGDYQEIRMTVDRFGWSPDKFVIQKDLPVKWIIDGVELNGCNNAIIVPKLGLDFDLVEGEQTIDFTATETGNIAWSCWMGMIPGMFVVVDDLGQDNGDSITGALNTAQVPQSGSCGASTGGCGCGNR